MNLRGQEGRVANILTPHPQSFSPLRGEGRNRRACRGTSGVQGSRREFSGNFHPRSLSMNLRGQEGRVANILTPHPQSFSPLRGEGSNRRACRGTSGVQGDKARIFGEISPSVPFHEPQGTRRGGGYNSHPSSSILLPVEGRRKKPADVSRNIGGSGGQGANRSGESHPRSLSMNLRGQEGGADIIHTPHPQSFSPLRGEGRNRRACRGTSGVQGDKARIFGEISPSVPFHEPQGTRRGGGEHSHPSSSILLPVEGRRKKPAGVSRNIGGSGGQGANFRGIFTLGPFP